jgi:hypothetical protein
MTCEEYERRAQSIETWAEKQYAERTMSERDIERAVERMYDKLDAEYCPGRYVPDLYQTRADVDTDDDGPYSGWRAMQSAMRDSW